MSKTVIYHNPRCSKSRETLQLLRTLSDQIEVIEYLKEPLDQQTLQGLLGKLKLKAGDIIRQKEAVFKENYKGRPLTESECLAALVAHPVLLERPIVVRGRKAVLGRPPENVRSLF
ncbi:MAG: arsenate reductase (glutaredoxin) [Leptospiraceae bacterium]|nr:arsenate reductase (glutaredoxin) [Leptospiraceae bacterium]